MATYQAINACTWRNGSWIAGVTDYVRQGVYAPANNYENVGAMLFDLTSIRNTYANYYPTSASIRLVRIAAGDWGSARTITLYAGNAYGLPSPSSGTSISGSRPTKVTSGYSYTVSAGQGTKDIAISTALIDSIGSGASNCLFMDAGSSTLNYMGFRARDDLSQIVLTINWAIRTTACSAPTSCSLNATLSEDNVTLSWSGASGGAGNAIFKHYTATALSYYARVLFYTQIHEMEVFLMKEIWNWIQLAFAAVGAFLGWFLGGFDGFLYALLAFVVVDYITGVMCAIVDKKLSSEVGFMGICKKVLIFVMVGVAHIMDLYLIGNGEVLRTAVIFFYCSNEGVSMLENAAHLGLPIPEKLKAALEQLHGREDGDGK